MEDIIQIQEGIRQFIVKASYVEDKNKITNDTLIFEKGILDSMSFVSLITFLEESFSIPLSEKDLLYVNFESIDAITKFVKNKLNLK